MLDLAPLAAVGPPAAACFHCGNPVPASRPDGYCCAGCKAVRRLLLESGLDRYYDLRPARTAPLFNYFDRRASFQWLDQAPGLAEGRLDLNVEGIQCAACVWAIEKLASRHGGAAVRINSALGRLSLRFDSTRFNVKAYLGVLDDLGYRVQPIEQGFTDRSQGLLLRLGVCLAVSMNTLFFSIPIYLGLREDSDGIYQVLRNLNFGLTVFSLLFGGSYFISRAVRSLLQGIAHFDLPIAIGVCTAFTGSLWAQWHGYGGTVYFDSVNAFLTLMLLGRYLQERALVHNRRRLFKSDAYDAGTVTVLDKTPRDIPFPQVQAGQTLLLQPGSLCPCPATLLEAGPAEFDCSAVNGEARPVESRLGEAVAAGSRLLSASAVQVLTQSPFNGSLLANLASAPTVEEELPILWRWAVRCYVVLVLLAACGGWAYWMWADPDQAPRVFIAALVVTCPCGLGIAVPLARTLADRRLFASGLTVCQAGLLERLASVKQVCLDKTGTLTFSHLELANPEVLDGLASEDLGALMGAAASSRHPVSRSLFRELSARGVPFPAQGTAVEVPGQGVVWTSPAGAWFLGRSMAKDGDNGPARAVLSRESGVIAGFVLTERVLAEAAVSLERLRTRGLDLLLLSGDHPRRVASMALCLGLKPAEARGGLDPAAKCTAVAAKPSLMLGDGLNDGPALRRALVSGTPAWERTLVSDGADFCFNAGSLTWLPELFSTAQDLRRAIWGNLAFAAVYNVTLLAFALRGLFSPLWCAVTMPAGSLLVIALTTQAMRPSAVSRAEGLGGNRP